MRQFLFLLFLIIGWSTHAQNYRDDKKPNDIDAKTTVLYSNDFSNPSEWTFQNSSSNGANWQISTNLAAAPIPFFHPAGFSSASNGFAIMNSDAQGSGETQDCILQLDTLISVCVSEPYVLLRFHQMLRRFNDTTSIEVSNDGSTWTQFLCNTGLENNVNTANPQKVDVNISSVAGNQDTVYIRFRYRASFAWFWAVDDVQILRQNQYDLEGLQTYFGSTGNWGKRTPYYQLPISQIAPISISGQVKNAGYETQVDAIITSSDGLSYTSTSIPEPLAGNLTGTFAVQNNWTPPASLGNKTIQTFASSSQLEGDTTNDALPDFSIEVHPKYYARSTDIRTGRVSNNSYQIGYETGNVFDMFADETIGSAMVHVASESSPGALLFCRLYEAIDSATFNLLASSDTVIVPALSADSVFRVRLINPTLLENGKSYLLTAGSSGSTTFPGLVMGTSNNAEIFTTFFLAQNSTVWFNFLKTPMVKMNFESVAELETLTEDDIQFQLFPNPSNGQSILHMNQGADEDFHGQLVSARGDVLLSFDFNGKMEYVINTNHLENGTYFLNLKGSNSNHTLKVLLLK